MTDAVHENVDLLSLVESQFEEQNIINAISESEIAIALYDYQAFLVEQDTYIFMELNYGIITEGVLENIWETVKNIFKKILDLLNKFKDYLKSAVAKFKSLKLKLKDRMNDKIEMQIVKDAAKANVELTKISLAKEAFEFIENYNKISSYNLFNDIVNSVEEYTQFCIANQKSENAPNNDEFIGKCPSFAKIEKACNGDTKNILPLLLKELRIPIDVVNGSAKVSDYINISEKYSAKEFLNEFKNLKRFNNITELKMENKYDDSDLNKKILNQIDSLSKIARSNVRAYGPMSKSFIVLCMSMNKLISIRASFYLESIRAGLAFTNNMIKCCNVSR